MTAYYNEFDPKAAAWLRELIARDLIAPGVVDERSIEDVTPDDLRGFTQCHFFAGIGVWSYALRRAGWPDDRPVWTGSCPCQPFSAAGKGGGFADERHLWPAFHWLISRCRPDVVFGEQVASKDGLGWLDLVQADLEGTGYASGAVDLCAAGVGAPHIRQRLYWVADANLASTPRHGQHRGQGETEAWIWGGPADSGRLGKLADTSRAGLPFGSIADDGRRALRHEGSASPQDELSGGLADAEGSRATHISEQPKPRDKSGAAEFGRLGARAGGGPGVRGSAARGAAVRTVGSGAAGDRGDLVRASPTNGLWRDADWLHCRDGKWRPVEPGLKPLAHGAPARVGRLRGYGNAIVAPAAQAFIEAYLEARADT